MISSMIGRVSTTSTLQRQESGVNPPVRPTARPPWLAAGLIVACLAAAPALAQRTVPAAPAEHRVALVIGNGTYPTAPLRNPVNDARDVAAALKSAGFQVALHENLGLRAMADAAREFGDRLRSDGVALFYFAGHGVQVKDRNYLIPVDADIQREDEVPYAAMDVGRIIDKMETARSRVNVVILDACRNNPFARSYRSPGQGLAQMDAPIGTLIAYATAPGKVALDNERKRNGIYTAHLLSHIRTPGLPIELMFKRVRDGVLRETGGAQTPWESSSLRGEFAVVPLADLTTAAPAASPAGRSEVFEAELVFWDAIKASNVRADYEAYLQQVRRLQQHLPRSERPIVVRTRAVQGGALSAGAWPASAPFTDPGPHPPVTVRVAPACAGRLPKV
jgi:uncharacterized caspase-like protein